MLKMHVIVLRLRMLSVFLCSLFRYYYRSPVSYLFHFIQSGLYSKVFTITTKPTQRSCLKKSQGLQNNSLQKSVQAPIPPVPTEEIPLTPLTNSSAQASPATTPCSPSSLSEMFSHLTDRTPCQILRFIPPAAKDACEPPVKPPPLDPKEIQLLSSSKTPGTEGTILFLTENKTFLFFSCHKDLISLRKENFVALCDFVELRLEVRELITLLPSCSSSLPSPSGKEDLFDSMRTLKMLGFDLIAPNSRLWPSASLSSEIYSCFIYKLD